MNALKIAKPVRSRLGLQGSHELFEVDIASTSDKRCSAEEVVLELTKRIYDTIRYRRRDEKGVQSPATTLSLGSGSCRDVATLLMEVSRHLNIASRFASGYLDCSATRAASGSTHAWTEVYLPNLGWTGFDCTTGQRCTFAHIPTGVSNHPRGVMPITGRFVGESGSYIEMNASVSFSEPA